MTRDDLLAAIRDARPESLPTWVGACAEAQAFALARLVQKQAGIDAGTPVTPGANGNLSASEAAKRLGVSRDFLYKGARAGRLPFAKRIGSRILFDPAGLERWDRQRRMA